MNLYHFQLEMVPGRTSGCVSEVNKKGKEKRDPKGERKKRTKGKRKKRRNQTQETKFKGEEKKFFSLLLRLLVSFST